MSDFESPLDKIIREAREQGAFDNLPGKGRPLQWEDESMIPEDQRLAQRVIRNSGFTLDWIELGQELDREYEALRRELETARAQGRLDSAGWKAAQEAFAGKTRALNRRIIGYNLRAPNEQFQKLPYSTSVETPAR